MTQLENEFETYHRENPRVYTLVKRFAAEAMKAGYTHYGIGAIWERVRWEINMAIEHKGNLEESFKMPNNHRAYYSRLWLKDNPNHPGFFRIAALRSQGGKRDRYGREDQKGV